MAKHVLKIDCACPSCGSTGVYVGMGEGNGAAVECRNCGGSGKQVREIAWEDFTEKKKRPGVKRVYAVNTGIVIGENRNSGISLEDFGGMSYEEWFKGNSWKPGMEDRKHSCPAWWYQAFNYKLKPEWRDCCGCGAFPECESFHAKDKCWSRWDKEFAPKFFKV